MRETIRLKPLLICLGVLTVFAGSYFAVHAVQVRRNVEPLLGAATRAEEGGRANRALKFLGLYLQNRPEDLEVRLRYAALLESMNLGVLGQRQILPVYDRILTLDPKQHAVRRKYVQLTMALGQIDEALASLNVLRKAFPDDGDIERLRGMCFEAKKEPAKAIEAYQSSIKLADKKLETYQRLALVLRDQGQRGVDQANEVLKQMVKVNKGSAEAWVAKARFHWEAKDLGKAAADLEEALTLAPNDGAALLLAAEVARKKGEPDKARARLRHLLEVRPDEPAAYEALAGVAVEAGAIDEALRWLRAGLAKKPGHGNLQWNLINLLLTEKSEAREARELLEALDKEAVSAARVAYLYAVLHFKEGNWREAGERLAAVRPQLADEPAMARLADSLLAQCCEHLGDADKAVTAYRQVIATDPLNVSARIGIVTGLMAQGRLGEADKECEKLVEMPRRPAAALLLQARLQILLNLRLAPAKRQWDTVNRVLEAVAKAVPDNPEVILLQAEAQVYQGKADEGRRLLEAARDKDPKTLSYWVGLSELAQRDPDPSAATRILDAAQKQLGDSVDLRLARSHGLMSKNDKTVVPAVVQLAEGAEKFPAEERARLLLGLGGDCAQLERLGEAARLWQQAAELEPKNLHIRLLLFDVARQEGDESAMKETLKAIQQIEGPTGPLGRYNEARYYVWQASKGDASRLVDARTLLRAVSRQRREWSRVPLAQAELEERDNHADRAIDYYLQAIRLGDRQLGAIRRVLELLYQKRRYAEADQVVRLLPEQTPAFDNLQRLAAMVSLQTKNPERALSFARKAIQGDSKDPAEHRWLGEVLWAAGEVIDAEKAFRRALELDGANPDNWVGLVQFLARSGQMKKAEAAVAAAEDKISSREGGLPLAQCYAAINKTAKAKELFQAALKNRKNDLVVLQRAAEFYLRGGDLKEAENLLKQVVRLQADDLQARRQTQGLLAVIQAASGDPVKVKESLVLIGILDEVTEDSADATAEKLRARAVVHASQPGMDHQREAIHSLETLYQEQRLSAEDQFLLVQLYDRVGDTQKAAAALQQLLTVEGENPRYLGYYVRSLLRQKQTGNAEVWLVKLEKRVPTGPQTIELRARLMALQGQGAEAANLLKTKVQLDDPKIRLQAAAVLEDIGQGAAAEELYRRHVKESKEPDAPLLLAQYLGRQGRVEEALKICDDAWATCPPAAVGYVSMLILHGGKADAAQTLRVKEQIEKAIQKGDKSVGLLVCLADLEDLRGRYAEAKTQYRNLLTRAPKTAEALNNLAWLLTFEPGQGEEALRLVNQAIEILGPIPELLDTRALAQLARNDPDAALIDLQNASGVHTAVKTLASVYFHQARALLAVHKRLDAVAAFRKAREAGLDVPALHPLEQASWKSLATELR